MNTLVVTYKMLLNQNRTEARERTTTAVAAEAEKNSINGEARGQRLHAMDYLEYAYLQTLPLCLFRLGLRQDWECRDRRLFVG